MDAVVGRRSFLWLRQTLATPYLMLLPVAKSLQLALAPGTAPALAVTLTSARWLALVWLYSQVLQPQRQRQRWFWPTCAQSQNCAAQPLFA